uniref:Uncharacterized protein n=1 Tax=Pelusios castaneus TaxID=367368 RepID=A0A8C8VKF5_9SAUR
MVKLWLSIRHMLNSTDYHRNFPSNTLVTKHFYCLLITHSHYPRCPIQVINLKFTCQWSLSIFHMYLSPHWMSDLPCILP